MGKLVKIVVTVPEDSAGVVREAIGKAGGGRLGNYSYASFSVKGTGRFLPGQGANPSVGRIGKMEAVAEERIEVTCRQDEAGAVVAAIKASHPYEEPVIDIYPLLNDV
jgi:hypothetical protein